MIVLFDSTSRCSTLPHAVLRKKRRHRRVGGGCGYAGVWLMLPLASHRRSVRAPAILRPTSRGRGAPVCAGGGIASPHARVAIACAAADRHRCRLPGRCGKRGPAPSSALSRATGSRYQSQDNLRSAAATWDLHLCRPLGSGFDHWQPATATTLPARRTHSPSAWER